VSKREPRKTLTLALVKVPYTDERGRKGIFAPFTRAQRHRRTTLSVRLEGWPKLRVGFLSDFHTGSHHGDVTRLERLVEETLAQKPDLVLLGGDFMNMLAFGGGRVAPRVIARALGEAKAPLGSFAVLGNHDYEYGAAAIAEELRAAGLVVLDDAAQMVLHGNFAFDIVGIPDARIERASAHKALASLQRPSIVLTHDPFWFAHVPAGPHLTLAGHTHGGQIVLPLIGPFTNKSQAPLRWTYGHIVEDGRQLYVTSGIGTSGLPIRFGARPEIVIIDIAG
jgi:predicted MPP superfamily phosphohydrolase